MLPNETEAPIVVTANVRAWRHILEMRANPHAETEIRALAFRAYLCLVHTEPLLFRRLPDRRVFPTARMASRQNTPRSEARVAAECRTSSTAQAWLPHPTMLMYGIKRSGRGRACTGGACRIVTLPLALWSFSRTEISVRGAQGPSRSACVQTPALLHAREPCYTSTRQHIVNPHNIYYFENPPIELPIRYYIRTYCHAQIYALWASQRRFQQWSQIVQDINWPATWLYINNNQKISNFTHSFQTSTLKSFRVKILLDELPTPHNLHKRNSNFSPLCHQCNHNSISLHWTTCPSTSHLNNLINSSLLSTLNTSTLDSTQNSILNLHQQIKNLRSMTIHNHPMNHHFSQH